MKICGSIRFLVITVEMKSKLKFHSHAIMLFCSLP